MIKNTNLSTGITREIEEMAREAREDGDFLDQKGRIKIRSLTKYDAPERFERDFKDVVREVQANVIDVDAKLMESNGKVIHYKNADAYLRSPLVVSRLARARSLGLIGKHDVEQAGATLREARSLTDKLQGRQLREGSDFEYGCYPDERPANGRMFPISDVALPTLNSPHAKNALLVDYLDAHRKTWEAATFNPIARRISRLIPQFVLGRGVKGAIDSKEHQQAWDEFHKLNRMRGRVKQSLKEIIVYGEIFWRFFNTKQGLLVRSLDPSTIWDIVTDEDDIEAVRYYHQQYLRMESSVVPGGFATPSVMVIRQIPAAEVAHYKINCMSAEKRGRSELFPILGYLLRFKEFINDRIAINKMRSMFALDVAVEGGQAEVDQADTQFSTPPGPAAVLVHNKGIEVDFKNTNANASDATADAEVILKVIAIGANISENFLGVSRSQTRAGALISTEPDVKNFEDYQELIEEILMDTAERVYIAKGLAVKPMEFTFPAIAQEDRSAKIKDIAFMESMDYFGKERAAVMAAREFQITDYDFKTEQQKIREERGRDPVISVALQQVPKIAPAEPGTEASPGLGPDLRVSKPGVTQTSGQMGFKADIGGGRGLADTKATLNRTGFTRGGEKTAIKNNRTSGTPLRHSVGGEPPPKGWNEDARQASLYTRRVNRLRRLTESAAGAQADGKNRRYLSLLKQIEVAKQVVEAEDWPQK